MSFKQVDLGNQENEINWNDISGVPVTFPSDWSQVSNKPVSFPSRWDEVNDKPSVFPTNWNNVTGKPSTFPGTWNNISGKPSAFPSTWSNVTGKPTIFPSDWSAIAGKPSSFPSSWNEVTGKPTIFPTNWNNVAGKPTKFTPTDNINVTSVTADNLNITSPVGGNSHIGYGTNGDIYLSTGTNGVLRHRRFNGTGYPVNVDIWTEENFDPSTKADTNHTHDYGTCSFDAYGIKFEGNKHGITRNDWNGNFNIRVGNNVFFDGTPNEVITENGYPFQTEYSQGSGWMQWNIGDSGVVGDACNWADTLQWKTGGELSINNSFTLSSPTSSTNVEIKAVYVSEGAYTVLEIWTDGIKRVGISKFNVAVLTDTTQVNNLRIDGNVRIMNPKSESQAYTGEIYVDANGFLKRK